MDSKNNHEIDSCYRLLAICACATAHQKMDEQLIQYSKEFTNWYDLPAQAELHGMSPLLWHHFQRLNISISLQTKQTLKGLYLRHRALQQSHTQALLEITALLAQKNIQAIVLKGLALAYEYYPDPILRPASDIDLLLKQDDVLPVLDVLTQAGYKSSFSLQSDFKQLPKELTVSSPVKNGLSTSIELHHYDTEGKSLIDNSPDDEFLGFDSQPHIIKVNNQEIYVPDPINHLDYLVRHLTRHLFAATDEKPLPLKWLTDIVSIVEHHAKEIDWAKNQTLVHRLEVIYSLTPFPENLSNAIPVKNFQIPKGVNQYPQGWPQKVFLEWKQKGFWYYLKNTIISPKYIWETLSVPSEWWLRLQYGIPKKSVFWYGQIIYRLQILKMAVAKVFSIKN